MTKVELREAMALLNFTKERLEQLCPKPKLFGKAKWYKEMLKFEGYFLRLLDENGRAGFYQAIWKAFECNDNLFIGENGMRELADHTTYKKEDGTWIYSKPTYGNPNDGSGPRVIYTPSD